MPKAKQTPNEQMWNKLGKLINAYAEAYASDAMKGGGDPIDVPVIEAELVAANARVNAQIALIRRELE